MEIVCAIGVVCLLLGRRTAYPHLSELDERFGNVYETKDIPKSDAALALWQELSRIEGGAAKQGDYERSIQYYMVLGSRSGAVDMLRQARARGLSDSSVESMAKAWGLYNDGGAAIRQ